MNKLQTQAQALDAIKSKQIIIGTVDAQGNFSVSANPVPQVSEYAARAECRRLAQLNPGKAYTFLKLAGAEMVPVTNTISV